MILRIGIVSKFNLNKEQVRFVTLRNQKGLGKLYFDCDNSGLDVRYFPIDEILIDCICLRREHRQAKQKFTSLLLSRQRGIFFWLSRISFDTSFVEGVGKVVWEDHLVSECQKELTII